MHHIQVKKHHGSLNSFLDRWQTLTNYAVSVMPRFTALGFEVVEIPSALFYRLTAHYRLRMDEDLWADERLVYPPSEFYERGLINTEREIATLAQRWPRLYPYILDTLRPLLQQWTGTQLVDTTVFGPRWTLPGTSMVRHVDRTDTHIISCSLCIDYELDTPWPIAVEDHFGDIHTIDLRPGTMLFYESASVPHWRPKSLEGSKYIGIFAHWRPREWEPPAIPEELLSLW